MPTFDGGLAQIGAGLGSIVGQLFGVLRPALLPILQFLEWVGPVKAAAALALAVALLIFLVRRSASGR